MSQVPPGGYQANELFCTFCDCAVALHGADGCECEDSKGHADTLNLMDSEEYCVCERTRSEFDLYGGWSSSFTSTPKGH